VSEIRRFLEPGLVVLVSSAFKGERNIMTLGWHTVMESTPSLVGCVIASGNHSFSLVSGARECVINVPTVDLARAVAAIGNCSGAEVRALQADRATGRARQGAADRRVLRLL
jgi:flavin reductase (DIM6/NTAB) family NADH-FMN oxidoreductase RutF